MLSLGCWAWFFILFSVVRAFFLEMGMTSVGWIAGSSSEWFFSFAWLSFFIVWFLTWIVAFNCLIGRFSSLNFSSWLSLFQAWCSKAVPLRTLAWAPSTFHLPSWPSCAIRPFPLCHLPAPVPRPVLTSSVPPPPGSLSPTSPSPPSRTCSFSASNVPITWRRFAPAVWSSRPVNNRRRPLWRICLARRWRGWKSRRRVKIIGAIWVCRPPCSSPIARWIYPIFALLSGARPRMGPVMIWKWRPWLRTILPEVENFFTSLPWFFFFLQFFAYFFVGIRFSIRIGHQFFSAFFCLFLLRKKCNSILFRLLLFPVSFVISTTVSLFFLLYGSSCRFSFFLPPESKWSFSSVTMTLAFSLLLCFALLCVLYSVGFFFRVIRIWQMKGRTSSTELMRLECALHNIFYWSVNWNHIRRNMFMVPYTSGSLPNWPFKCTSLALIDRTPWSIIIFSR